MDRYFLSIIVILSLVIFVVPPLVGLIFGRDAICNKPSNGECLRDWLTALAGPLTILAAAIAAWPVYDQLAESRVATKYALASVIKFQEDDLTGAMSALREESDKVKKTKMTLYQIEKAVNYVLNLDSDLAYKENMGLDSNVMNDDIDQCSDVATDLASKGDKDTILTRRNDVAKNLMNVKMLLQKIREEPSSARISDHLRDDLMNLQSNVKDSQFSLDQYNDQYLKQNDKMVKERDVLTMRRKSLTVATSVDGL